MKTKWKECFEQEMEVLRKSIECTDHTLDYVNDKANWLIEENEKLKKEVKMLRCRYVKMR